MASDDRPEVSRSTTWGDLEQSRPVDDVVARRGTQLSVPGTTMVNPFQWSLLGGLITFFAVISFTERWSVVAFGVAFVGIFVVCLHQNRRATAILWQIQQQHLVRRAVGSTWSTSTDD